jgi:intracellular sulfur oxidation DsrE/DsrF family protein
MTSLSRVCAATLALVFLFAFGSTTVATQEDTPEPAASHKVVILVRDLEPFLVAFKTADSVLAGKDVKAAEVIIVACGPGVKLAVKGGEIEAELKRLTKLDTVRVVACGLSMQRHNVERANLVEGVEVIDNGLLETLRLQIEGWVSVEL